MTIESLPDEVLLEVFYFHLISINEDKVFLGPQGWLELVHVCRRWRCIVFDAPLRLDLELYCTEKTPVRKLLHIWPQLPLAINCSEPFRSNWNGEDRLDNVIAALEHRDRVRKVELRDLSSSTLERIKPVMQEPFPALKDLCLEPDLSPESEDEVLTIPDTFLNGSAPSLQSLSLACVSFPSLPRLLLSATRLTNLHLFDIPNTGYISPESIATSLSASTNLETLTIEFEYSIPYPRRDRPRPPPTRIVLPVLTTLSFRGASDYLEVIAARIGAPLLNEIEIDFFNQLILDTPQVARLIGPRVLSRRSTLSLSFYQSSCAGLSYSDGVAFFRWNMICNASDSLVHAVAQLCTQILPLCSSVDMLNIMYDSRGDIGPPLGTQPHDMDPARLLELFYPFTAVQSLVIHAKLEPFIAAALQGLTEQSAAEVFPTLERLFLVEYTKDRAAAAQRGIRSFITARQHSDHPVALHR
jgi:F-box-like